MASSFVLPGDPEARPIRCKRGWLGFGSATARYHSDLFRVRAEITDGSADCFVRGVIRTAYSCVVGTETGCAEVRERQDSRAAGGRLCNPLRGTALSSTHLAAMSEYLSRAFVPKCECEL